MAIFSEVNVPTDVIAVCAAPVTVAAVPDTLPVTLPVNTGAVDSPSFKSITTVSLAPFADVFF